MVPNQDVHRPVVVGAPFSTALICDRACMGWQQVMETRYYLYPVHTSRSFLHVHTLAARLYLVLQLLLRRSHRAAARLMGSCHVDTDFTAEEKWVFEQLERSLDDKHPDAHACRLKLSVALMYSNNRTPWENHVEVSLS